MKTLTENTLMAFSIGRGGRYNNQGHLSFLDQDKSIAEYTDKLFITDRDSKGRFITPEYTDAGGHFVGLTLKEAETGCGSINIDGDYDTTYVCKLKDCSEEELRAILDSDRYYSTDVRQYIEQEIIGIHYEK